MRARLMNLSNRDVLLILFVLFAGGSLWSLGINLSKSDSDFAEWGESWLQNFSTEMFGAFLTFVLLTLVLGHRQEKERLVRRLRSKVPGEAQRAAEEMIAFGWFKDGTLQNADLIGACLQATDLPFSRLQGTKLGEAILQDVDLRYAHLQRAELWNANLQAADLHAAKMQGVYLIGANLQWANLWGASLQGATLRQANLQEADLNNANLQGADLWGADLKGANLKNALFDEKTLLPDTKFIRQDDGKRIFLPDSYYKPGVTDMRKYTDPTHPAFWRSDDPTSPAYKGEDADETE